MSFHVYVPGYPLSRFVRCFYAPKGVMPYGEEKVLPSAQTDLKINFGEPFLARQPGEAQYHAVDSDGWFMGVWDRYHCVHWPRHPDFVGISFWPGGAHALLGIDVDETYNRIIPLEAVWGRFARELRQRLGEVDEPLARFRLTEALLSAQVLKVIQFDKIADTLQALRVGAGLTQSGKLSSLPEFTPKHLITLFNRVVGVSPKRLARLHRLQGVIDAIECARPISWTAMSQDFLFADQAHFNKEFKWFTGHAPGDYRRVRQNLSRERPDHARFTRLLPLSSQ